MNRRGLRKIQFGGVHDGFWRYDDAQHSSANHFCSKTIRPWIKFLRDYLSATSPQHVGFDSRMIALITTATLTTLGADDLLARHIRESLAAGVKPVEIREAIYQGFAYVGIAQVSRAEKVFAQVLKDAGINPELTDCTTVNDADRFEKGLAVQKGNFRSGDRSNA